MRSMEGGWRNEVVVVGVRVSKSKVRRREAGVGGFAKQRPLCWRAGASLCV